MQGYFYSDRMNQDIQYTGAHPAKNPLTSNHWVIENPKDIATASQIIWDTTANYIQQLQNNTKCILSIGEFHALPTHLMTQMNVISRVQHSQLVNKFTVATEIEHTYNLEWVLEEMQTAYDAPISHTKLFQFLDQKKIDVLFNDVLHEYNPSSDEYFIHSNDKLASSIIKKNRAKTIFAKLLSPKVTLESTEGMHVRNESMVLRTKDHLDKNKNTFAVQLCGASHLYGNKDSQDPYEESITHHYNNVGFKTIGALIAPSKKTIKNIPQDAWEENHHHIIIEGLDSRKFEHEKNFQTANKQDPKLLNKEILFLHGLTMKI